MTSIDTRTFSTWKRAALAVIIATTMSACLLEDVNETWYLDPDGGVTWTVVERDVRSDAQAETDRAAEETTFITAVGLGNHPVARGLTKLVPAAAVTTQILHPVVPYTVTTEARFSSIATLGQRLIGRMGLSGTSTLERGGNDTLWTWSVRDPRAENAASDDDEDMNTLAGGLDGLRVVLSRGRFTDAKGFALSADHRVATLIDLDKQVEADDRAPLVLQLRWQ